MTKSIPTYKVGLDVGSTTAKVVFLESNNKIVHSEYRRHNAKIHEVVGLMLANAHTQLGECKISLVITGSAGLGISEKLKLPFIQEVIAATEVVMAQYPDVKTLIDIGGEDSKMIFFSNNKATDIRMNGSCAGGTGAFIDQMASLMNISPIEMSELASKHKNIYPIASRCGVFAKTDVQNLLSRKIPKEDVAASVFQAVVVQTINTLARGYDFVKKVMLIGGPFHFLPELKKTFLRNLQFSDYDCVETEVTQLMPALGAALSNDFEKKSYEISLLQKKLRSTAAQPKLSKSRLAPLFTFEEEKKAWFNNKIKTHINILPLNEYLGTKCFLGIDSGSTTTKITVVGTQSELLYSYYRPNNGSPIEVVTTGIKEFIKQKEAAKRNDLNIVQTAVTGYGEDLIKAAFNLDIGIVETIAHFTAARNFNPKVSFIMDIGGQDMKAIFIENGVVNRIELNESCSAGCGSFIQTFGKSLGYELENFAQIACNAKAPADLGTRCTVFMNSKVKQSLRENAGVEDIAAGLSISVIKNALYKVLQLKDTKELGEHIVVQGGTFKNPAVLRALEMHIGREVITSNIPELMGAFGASLLAKERYFEADTEPETSFSFRADDDELFKTKQQTCKACENFCVVSRFMFDNENVYYSGNKCEAVFSNKGEKQNKGFDFFEFKHQLLFGKTNINPIRQIDKKIKIGIPRVLNMYENYPFWNTLFSALGFDVVLSGISTMQMYENGQGFIMSDSICFPAKLVHGHIINLTEKNVERVFYPIVIFEKKEYKDAHNSYNCPIVSSYSDVIDSSMNTSNKFNLTIDRPLINFSENKMLQKTCFEYLKTLGVKKSDFNKAFEMANHVQITFKETIKKKGAAIIKKAKEDNRMTIVLAGRPYHTDKLINHKIPDLLTGLGVDVLTEDAVPESKNSTLSDLKIISQWAYPNRIYKAAQWVAEQGDDVQMVQFNSFGCGPDAIVIDEITEVLKAVGKNLTLIRIDDITSTGSVRLRLRSMIESLHLSKGRHKKVNTLRKDTAVFTVEDKKRTILTPVFGEMYSPLINGLFVAAGYKIKTLPLPDKSSVDYGLRFSNNEICYPATVVVGDIIKALKSGNYKRDEIAVSITQTGGQCRATTYLSLIKKAMTAAGFEDVPVVAIGTSGLTINPQPGFDINWRKMLKITFCAIWYADSLSKLYQPIVVREKNKGQSKELVDKYQQLAISFIEKKDIKSLFILLKEAVEAFNNVPIHHKHYPKIGIVGEIYVKYNSFGHNFIIDWLVEQGVEVVVPPIVDFFLQDFVNIKVNKDNNQKRSYFSDFMVYFFEKYAEHYIRRFERILEDFKFYSPFHRIKKLSEKAGDILNLASQFGEGWLIPAELSSFAEEGVNHVVSVQPFGCIANHIVSKGIEKKLKNKYPDLNLLFLDFDDGTTEVNILNRLHFMLRNVKKEAEEQQV